MSIKKYFFMTAVASVLAGSIYAGSYGAAVNSGGSSQKPDDKATQVLLCFNNLSKPECKVLGYRSCGDLMSQLDQGLIDEYGITCSDIM